jgi:hypothetical protein
MIGGRRLLPKRNSRLSMVAYLMHTKPLPSMRAPASAKPSRERAAAQSARMRARTTLLAAVLPAAVFTAAPAFAQGPQPVPYNTPQVPYGQSAPPGQAPPPARPAGSDVIYLKGGGILRGTLIDAIPNAQARIQLATGEIATVPWQQIDKIDQGRGTGPAPGPLPPPAPSGPAPTPAGPPAPPPAMIPVHVEGPEGAELQRAAGSDGWKTVCNLPCDKQLPTGTHYRIAGEGLRTSADFTLEADAGQRETMSVNGGSKGLHTLGIVGIIVGATATPIGLLVALVGYAIRGGCDLTLGGCSNDGSGTIAAGWTLTAIGVGSLIGGIILTVNNSKTTVSQQVTTGAAPEAFKRTPTWREAGAVDRSVPPAFGIPILSGTF